MATSKAIKTLEDILNGDYSEGYQFSSKVGDLINESINELKWINKIGKTYLIDGSKHICVEDNRDRGIFQAIGIEFKDWSIKPTIVALFSEIVEIN